MQIRSWIFVTVGTLLLTGFVLNQAGWFSKSGSRFSGRHSTPRVHATTQDLFASESGNRYRRCQVNHWKYLVLKN